MKKIESVARPATPARLVRNTTAPSSCCSRGCVGACCGVGSDGAAVVIVIVVVVQGGGGLRP